MTAPRVEADGSRAQPAETNATATPKAVEVAHFRAALAAGDAGRANRTLTQATDADAMATNEAGARAERLFDMATHETQPMPDDSGAGDPQEEDPNGLGSLRTGGLSAASRELWHVPPSAVATRQAVVPRKRVELGTHLARQSAMQPLADLLALVRQRAPGQAVTDLKIVPPEPNPLQLTLHLSMDGEQFVVKARTALAADRRGEVQQALHVLESALAARLRMPARVVLLA